MNRYYVVSAKQLDELHDLESGNIKREYHQAKQNHGGEDHERLQRWALPFDSEL